MALFDLIPHFLCSYGLRMDIIRLDFKSGLEALLRANPIKAIFLGVRIGDPTAVPATTFNTILDSWPPNIAWSLLTYVQNGKNTGWAGTIFT